MFRISIKHLKYMRCRNLRHLCKYTNKNYYEILGVSSKASNKEIRHAFLDKAKEFHPDVASGNSHITFTLVNEAYSTLSKPGLRSDYDFGLGRGEIRTQKKRSSYPPYGYGPSDHWHDPFHHNQEYWERYRSYEQNRWDSSYNAYSSHRHTSSTRPRPSAADVEQKRRIVRYLIFCMMASILIHGCIFYYIYYKSQRKSVTSGLKAANRIHYGKQNIRHVQLHPLDDGSRQSPFEPTIFSDD